jgi:hypothetical protein
VIYTYIRQFAETFLGIKKLVHALDNVDTKMELPSPTVLNERRVSGQPAQPGNGEFTVTGRKLLLSAIIGNLDRSSFSSFMECEDRVSCRLLDKLFQVDSSIARIARVLASNLEKTMER